MQKQSIKRIGKHKKYNLEMSGRGCRHTCKEKLERLTERGGKVIEKGRGIKVRQRERGEVKKRVRTKGSQVGGGEGRRGD